MLRKKAIRKGLVKMLDIKFLKNAYNNVKINNFVGYDNKVIDHLYDNVDATFLGTKLGELLASKRLVSQDRAMTIVKHDILRDLKGDRVGLKGDRNYLECLTMWHFHTYQLNGNGLPVTITAMDLKALISDVLDTYKKVVNY